MKNNFVIHTIAALTSLSLLGGCTSSTEAGKGVRVEGPAVQSSGKGGEEASNEVKISSRAKLQFEDAVKAYDAAKKTKAIDYAALERKFEAAFESDPNLAEAQYNLGVLKERQGKPNDAITHYRAALKVKPTLRQAAENLGVLAENSGDAAGAVGIYQQILQQYPDDASARARLAEIYRKNQDHEKAMEFSRQALMREPKSMLAFKVMMLSYLDRKQLSMAKLVALRALKIDEQDPELYHTVGLILSQENEPEKARSQFTRAVEVRPDYLPSHFVLARLALDAEDYPGAEVHLRRILQADGKNAEAHLNLGVVYKGMGQYDKAMQEYDQAEKLKPELAAVILNRAIILHRHKDAHERAIELYKSYLAKAGGEISLSADAPVFTLMKEAETIVQAKEEAKRAEEEAKKMEELAKQQEAETKRQEAALAAETKKLDDAQKAELARAEKAQKEADFRAAQDSAKGNGPKDSGKDSGKDDKKEEKKVEKKPEPKPEVIPAKGTATGDEPGDEPSDGL